MKKMVLALTTSVVASGAMAASTATLSTSTKKSAIKEFLKSTTASVYLNFQRSNIDTDTTTAAQYLILRNKINDEFTTKLEVRSLTQDVATADKEANAPTMIDPRFTIYGLNGEINTAAGKISINPALRTEIAINDNSEDRYARLRLGVTASMNTNAANNLAVFLGTYETITKSNADRALAQASNIYFWAADTFNLNDQHSITALYENFRNLNQATLEASNKYSESDLTVYYNNNAIKGLSISPYVGQNLGNDFDADLLRFGVDTTYAF